MLRQGNLHSNSTSHVLTIKVLLFYCLKPLFYFVLDHKGGGGGGGGGFSAQWSGHGTRTFLTLLYFCEERRPYSVALGKTNNSPLLCTSVFY